jgi:hypothetical protein
MSDALSLALPSSLVTVIQPLGAPLVPVSPQAPQAQGHVDFEAPFYISPAISFDPVTDIVIFTYRNAETGKVTEQIPPNVVLARYQAAEETGIPNPTLPPLPLPTFLSNPVAPAKPSVSITPPSPTPVPAATGDKARATPPNAGTIV